MQNQAVVVNIDLRIDAGLSMYRVEATVQLKAGNAMLYNQHHTYLGTYAEVIQWLGNLLSEDAASAPLVLS